MFVVCGMEKEFLAIVTVCHIVKVIERAAIVKPLYHTVRNAQVV